MRRAEGIEEKCAGVDQSKCMGHGEWKRSSFAVGCDVGKCEQQRAGVAELRNERCELGKALASGTVALREHRGREETLFTVEYDKI